MSLTVYTNTFIGGSAAGDVSTLASGSGSLASGAFLYGFIDGSQRARFFYSSLANSINLPTLVAPPVVPLNFVGVGNSTAANCVVYQLQQTGSDYGLTVAGNGPFIVTLSFSAGSPDSASPFQFTLDAQATLLVESFGTAGA
jgi:hypothetical protein